MKNFATPKQCFDLCKIAGFSLLFAFWVKSGETTGFFLLLFLIVMALLRWRVPKSAITLVIDFAVCAALSVAGVMPGVVMALPLFEAMYLGFYGFAPALLYAFFAFKPSYAAILAMSVLCGFFLSGWKCEYKQKQRLRDAEAGRYYELESLQCDLVAALAQIEQMTTVAERARIARDIHDNAGHEIVAAYMSFQAVRRMLAPENADSANNTDTTDTTEMIQLYDAALARLASGTDKIREAVHNLSTVNFLGAQRLREKCRHFLVCKIDFQVYGDTAPIPIYVWSMLESCLSEALTNIARHSAATWVTVTLDATPHIVRLCVANDGVTQTGTPHGSGIRNLRHRVAAIGGSLSVDTGEVFTVICVIPLRMSHTEGNHEAIDC